MPVTELELARRAKAPRITEASLEANIVAEHYFTAFEGRMGSIVEGTYESRGSLAGSDHDLEALELLTFCVLVLANGFTITGMSHCASKANYNRDIGQRFAREDAVRQIWQFMGYELRTKLHEAEQVPEFQVDFDAYQAQSDEDIARICHQANKSWCEMNGDFSQKDWDEAPQWQKDSAILGVQFHRANPDASDSASHDSWSLQKVVDGWTWGEVKDEVKRTHPCLVPFEDLPHAQQFKDKLFRTICRSALDKNLTSN